jgi:hypothetical protein
MVDLDATDGELEAAVRAATQEEIKRAEVELGIRLRLCELKPTVGKGGRATAVTRDFALID